jgi:hypothetical protein
LLRSVPDRHDNPLECAEPKLTRKTTKYYPPSWTHRSIPQEAATIHFASCHELLADDIEADFSSFVRKIETLSSEFEKRFRDFEKLKPSLLLFNNPMEVNVETLQLELCELQSDPFLLTKKNENPKSFWKLVCKDRDPKLRDFALKLHSFFSSTYICECTFSTMKHVKSKNRNQMGDKTLDACLRHDTTNIDNGMDTLVKEKT